MKFKNSYLLLIAMAIFLLVSIGSVCASEDITTDDTQLASTDADVVLADGEDEPNDGETTQEKITTEITADDNKEYNQNETKKNITNVIVKDNESNPITIEKANLTVTENGNNVTFDYNNSIITIKDIEVGEHKLNITYIGNELYNASSILINLVIIKDTELEVPEVVDITGSTADIKINLTDGVHDNTKLLNSTNTQVTLKYGETNETITVNWDDVVANNKLTIDVTNKIPATVILNFTDKNGKSIVKNVNIKYKTTVNITPEIIEINEGENATFNIKVIGADGNPLNITKENLTISTTGASNKFNATTGNLTLIGLKKGVYNITITYKGNDVNNTSKAKIVINVRGAKEINTNVTSLDINSTLEKEFKIINITDGVDTFDFTKADLNITYKIGNKTYDVEFELDENGTIKFKLEDGNFTTATLIINYKDGNATKNITLNRKYNVKIDAINTHADYQGGNFTFRVIDIDTNTPLANKTISLEYKIYSNLISVGGSGGVTIQNSISVQTNENGEAIFDNSKMNTNALGSIEYLSPGNHTVTLSGSTLNIKNGSSQNITIDRITVNIKLEEFNEYYQTDKKVKIIVTNAKTGTPLAGVYVLLDITGATLSSPRQLTNVNGTIELGVNGLPTGTYKMTFTTNDTNLNKTTSSGSFTIKPLPVVINAKDVSIYYNTGTTYTVKVTKDGKGVSEVYVHVRLYTTSSKYSDYLFLTNNNGQFSFSASLAVGKHKIIVSTADNRYDAAQVTKTITVKKASAKITAKKVTTYYKASKYFTVKLTNTKNKKAIYDAKINIKIYISKNRYYNYNGNTGMNGQLKLLLDSLKPGTYKVVVSGADSKNFKASKVTTKIVIKKAPTKLVAKKVIAKKGKTKYFKVTAKNKKTKKVISGIKLKVKVYSGKKFKTYTIKTNSKGIAQLNVKKIKVGTHKVIITSANKYCVAKQTKSTIQIKK